MWRRAERRLRDVPIGMDEGKFLQTMKAQVYSSQGTVLTMAMDGWISKCGETVEHPTEGRIRTYVFGYVDAQNIVHRKHFVVAKNDVVVESKGLGGLAWESKESFVLDLSHATREDYERAMEYSKHLVPGMWLDEFLDVMSIASIWTGQNIRRLEMVRDAGAQVCVAGPGYLWDKYSEQNTDEGRLQEFYFGYEEAGKLVLGFVVRANNLQITGVEYLEVFPNAEDASLRG